MAYGRVALRGRRVGIRARRPRSWAARVALKRGKLRRVPVGSRKRLRRRPLPLAKRRRTKKQASGSHEYSRYSTSIGRFGRQTLKNAFKHLRSLEEYAIVRWNGVKSWNTNGYYWMNNTPSGGGRVCPLYIFNLTALPKLGLTCTPFLQMAIDASDNPFFGAQTSVPAVGTGTTTGLVCEKTSQRGFPSIDKASIMQWADIRMNLWGCKNKPTKWCIQLVKFRSKLVDPWYNLVTTAANQSEYKDFWYSQVAPYMFNPIHHDPNNNGWRLKVVKTWTFTQDPTLTIENDTDPKCKELRIFHKFNKYIKWDTINNGTNTVARELDAPGYTQVIADTSTNCYADSRYGYYLMIRALNCGADEVVDNTNTPSFDLSVRMKHVYNSYA